MFAPIGYVPIARIASHIVNYSGRFYTEFALPNTVGKDEAERIETFRAAVGGATLYAHWLLDYCLYQQPVNVYLASPDGRVLRASHSVFFSREQYSVYDFEWPMEKGSSELSYLITRKISEDWPEFALKNYCFLGEDFAVRIREIPEGAFEDSEAFLRDAAETLKPLTGWAVCISEADVPALMSALSSAFNWEARCAVTSNSEAREGRSGRPEKQSILRATYFGLFPDGHQAAGKTWKQALAAVSAACGKTAHEVTLKRAIRGTKHT